MSTLAERLRDRFYRSQDHPYQILERTVERYLLPDLVLLDAGCGRTAPLLAKYRGRARRLIGIDRVEFAPGLDGIELLKNDLASMDLEDSSVDLVVSRSVMEHLSDPAAVYAEVRRVLKPGGRFIFITPNFWDYVSLIAWLVPNRLHPWIVSRTEGRAEDDVFPIQYRSNTRRAVKAWASASGFKVTSIEYLGQYPSYFMFNGGLFLLATAYEKLTSKMRSLAFLRGWVFAVLEKP